MAQSTCLKCGNNVFELVVQEPRRSNYKYNFVQCAHCGGVVGVVEHFNSGALLHKVMARLGIA
jgi:hypothetical protein